MANEAKSKTEIIQAGGRIFVVARTGLNPLTIWTYDGSVLEPVPGATDIEFPSGLTVLGDSLYFTAQKGDDFWLYQIKGVPEPAGLTLMAMSALLVNLVPCKRKWLTRLGMRRNA